MTLGPAWPRAVVHPPAGQKKASAMPLIVVGGSGRNVGKTSLVCGLIEALREYRWVAVKVTGHEHGVSAPVWEELITNLPALTKVAPL